MRRWWMPPITWLTVPQAAERLGVCSSTVGNLIADGALDATRVGGDWRIQADVVRAYKDRGLSQTPDRFDRALTLMADRIVRLRRAANEHAANGRPGEAEVSDDAAYEAHFLLVLVLSDAFGREEREDRAQARTVETVRLLLEAAREKLAGAGAL